jgi:hypothetical protein
MYVNVLFDQMMIFDYLLNLKFLMILIFFQTILELNEFDFDEDQDFLIEIILQD